MLGGKTEKSLPKRGRINLERPQRGGSMKLIPRNFRLCYSRTRERSIRSIHSWNHAPFPPLSSPRFVSFRRAYADRWPRYRYKPSELFRVPLPRGSLQSIQIDTNRKVAGEWRGGEKFDSLVIRCQVERISMTRNGQCFSTVFFKSCFNETIVKRMWREWRINEGGEGKNRYLI